MASDVIESEAVLKAVSDMDLNNSSADFVTPRRTHEEFGNRQTSSPSSSGVSGDGDEEELDDLQNSTASTVENGEEAPQESATKTRGTPQERTTPDNEQEQPGARSSTPVSLPQPSSPPGPSGRSVYLPICLYGPLYNINTTFKLTTLEPDDCIWSDVGECVTVYSFVNCL